MHPHDLAGLTSGLHQLRGLFVMDGRDWTVNRTDAAIYAIIAGIDDTRLADLADLHRWDAGTVLRIAAAARAVRLLTTDMQRPHAGSLAQHRRFTPTPVVPVPFTISDRAGQRLISDGLTVATDDDGLPVRLPDGNIVIAAKTSEPHPKLPGTVHEVRRPDYRVRGAGADPFGAGPGTLLRRRGASSVWRRSYGVARTLGGLEGAGALELGELRTRELVLLAVGRHRERCGPRADDRVLLHHRRAGDLPLDEVSSQFIGRHLIGHRHDVRRDAILLMGEEGAGAADAGECGSIVLNESAVKGMFNGHAVGRWCAARCWWPPRFRGRSRRGCRRRPVAHASARRRCRSGWRPSTRHA